MTDNISFVVQGPVRYNLDNESQVCDTKQVLLSIRKHFPNAEIVLSTWKGTNTSNLVYDQLILSDDPGGFTHKASTINCNRMILTSTAGIKQATYDIVVKTRTDIMFVSNQLINALDLVTPLAGKYRLFSHYIVSTTLYVRNPLRLNLLFHGSDILLVGRKQDLLSYFDAAPADRTTFVNEAEETKITPEQYLLLSRIKAKTNRGFKIPYWGYINLKLFIESERFIFKNFVFIDADKLGAQFPERLYNVFMPEANYTISEAKCLNRIHSTFSGELLSLNRALNYFTKYYVPYYKAIGWRKVTSLLISKVIGIQIYKSN
jgi:hypothetical protein